MTIHTLIRELRQLLLNLDGWLDKAVAHAAAGNTDANALLQARLAPDMFPLVRQIQSACDQVKFAAARTSGKAPPSHPDTEQTIDELKRRIAAVVAYVDTFTPADWDNVEQPTATRRRWEGKVMSATDYLVEFALPICLFHITMTYALLRHSGVELGKRDFIGRLSLR